MLISSRVMKMVTRQTVNAWRRADPVIASITSGTSGGFGMGYRIPFEGGVTRPGSQPRVMTCATGFSARVGDQVRLRDARERDLLVLVGSVAADADGAQQLALRIADQHPAPRGRDATAGDGGQRGEEGRVAIG